jgi:hypothetical protein
LYILIIYLRAERFGIEAKELVEQKKMSRAERFGLPAAEKAKTDEKKRARAERFGTANGASGGTAKKVQFSHKICFYSCFSQNSKAWTSAKTQKRSKNEWSDSVPWTTQSQRRSSVPQDSRQPLLDSFSISCHIDSFTCSFLNLALIMLSRKEKPKITRRLFLFLS